MKRLGLGLAVLCAAAFCLSATGGPQAWGQTQRQWTCPSQFKPICGFDVHATCTPYGWACVANKRGGGEGGDGDGERSRSRGNCFGGLGQVTCVAGWLPACHNGHWRCEAPTSPY